MNIYEKISEARKNKVSAMLCTVISVQGSTPRKPGSKMLVYDTSKIYGTIGGGILEHTVISKAVELMNSLEPKLIHFDLTKDLGMACGGSVDIFIEPVSIKNKLFIFGAGHIGKALANIVKSLDFDVYIIDNRENIFDDWVIDSLITCNISNDEFINNHNSDINSFIVIITPSHSTDVEVLKRYIRQDFAYCGMIGSKRKALEIKKLFLLESLATEDEFSRIDLPIGLEIGAEGPEEIAISIASKLVMEKNKRK